VCSCAVVVGVAGLPSFVCCCEMVAVETGLPSLVGRCSGAVLKWSLFGAS
jgi:hypothetical protein